MQVAVTGGSGCLGRALIQKLTETGVHPRILVRSHERQACFSQINSEMILGDINSPEALANLTKGVEIVFHLAGKVHMIPRTIEGEKEFYRVNTEGTRLLIEAAAKNKVKRIILYSTVGVYGDLATLPGDEKSRCNPLTVYAKSKYDAEQLVLDSHTLGGPEGVVLRFPVTYGPYDRGNMAKLIKAIYYRYFILFGDGKNLRSMISSTNSAEAAILAAFEPKAADEIFCLTDERDYSMLELIESICTALKRKSRPLRFPQTFGKIAGKFADSVGRTLSLPLPFNSDHLKTLTGGFTFSSDKARNILGYKAMGTLDEGILSEVRWLGL